MLYPRESETREIKDLSGLWRFRVDKKDEGIRRKWFARPLGKSTTMPVPSSYNDLTRQRRPKMGAFVLRKRWKGMEG